MAATQVDRAPLDAYPHVREVQRVLDERFPYFARIIDRQVQEFGPAWLAFLESDLAKFFQGDLERLGQAVFGYGRFALDGMRLQKLFDKTHRYEFKSYAEASDEVYQNRDYMFSLYLPGIYLSHFLWLHHYKQHVFFEEKFLPLVRNHGGMEFYDVGVGTGFYSKEMLRALPDIRGNGFDLSPYSLEHTAKMVDAFGFLPRYQTNLRNIVSEPIEKPAPFIINIEVLEHLEDPQEFLNALCKMLEPGGYGLISAALTAPNADHIYLYNTAQEVADQLVSAGFKVLDHIEDEAYQPRKPGDTVPRNAAFIVSR